MIEEFNDPGGLSAFLLSVNTMLMLEKKGVLTHDEMKEIVEQALLNLETHQQKATWAAQQVFQASRGILEEFRKLISRPSARR